MLIQNTLRKFPICDSIVKSYLKKQFFFCHKVIITVPTSTIKRKLEAIVNYKKFLNIKIMKYFYVHGLNFLPDFHKLVYFARKFLLTLENENNCGLSSISLIKFH